MDEAKIKKVGKEVKKASSYRIEEETGKGTVTIEILFHYQEE